MIPFALYKIGSQPSFIANVFRSAYNNSEGIRNITAIFGTVLSQGLIEFPQSYPLVATTSLQWVIALIFMFIIFIVYSPIVSIEKLGKKTKKVIDFLSEKSKETEVRTTAPISTAKERGVWFFLVIGLLAKFVYQALAKLLNLT